MVSLPDAASFHPFRHVVASVGRPAALVSPPALLLYGTTLIVPLFSRIATCTSSAAAILIMKIAFLGALRKTLLRTPDKREDSR